MYVNVTVFLVTNVLPCVHRLAESRALVTLMSNCNKIFFYFLSVLASETKRCAILQCICILIDAQMRSTCGESKRVLDQVSSGMILSVVLFTY